MCRFVILAIIAASFISCVLAQAAQNNTIINCKNDTRVLNGRGKLRRCFNTTVELHLNSSATLKPGDCRNASDFGRELQNYVNMLQDACNTSLTINTTNIVKLIDFSLSNDSFKRFYEDKDCLIQKEYNISNTCVKNKVGFFNISEDRKHTTWYQKTILKYEADNCENSNLVQNCVAVQLQHCTDTTADYVVELFKYARNLGDCSRFPTATLPPSGSSDTADSWLTLPVIITLSIGAVVIVAAVITIIVLKCKNK